jgi:murein L,D-transpeptidase YcbB/YkuD
MRDLEIEKVAGSRAGKLRRESSREDVVMLHKGSLGFVLVSLCLLLTLTGTANAGDGLRERLERLREMDKPAIAQTPLASARLLDDFYRQRGYRYAWTSSRQVDGLLTLADASVDEGLRPRDFHAQQIRDSVSGLPPSDFPASARVDADILLSDSLLRLVHHRRYGKVDPQRIDDSWNHMEGPRANDLVDDLERAVSASDLQIEVEGLASRPAFYTRLKKGLARYRRIADAGGWPSVPAGKSLKPGMSDSRVPVMRERLRATGDYQGSASESRKYDKGLEAAVLAFQKRHHLGVDGIVGPATLAAMNISAEERVDQIRVNLERMRWVYDDLPDDLLLVDIAGQEVQLRRGEEIVWTSRVIVGREERPTPVFRDQIEYLEINPNWTVPPTILKKDILPAMRKNPGYLKKKGLQVVTRGGKPVSAGSVDWNTPAASFPYMIRQPPGDKNALGQVKFMFPNRFSVYLHDTPNRNLFQKPRRLYSSGCVRVERPWELAELVLNNPKRWNQEKFEEIVASRKTRWVHLKQPLPVILAYWTAEAGKDGEVMFREDVYQRDSAVLSALDGRGPIRVVYQAPEQPEPPGPDAPEKQNAAAPEQEPETRAGRLKADGVLAAY